MCDRDGTLIADVPYNGNPALVTALEGVVDGLAELRTRGLPLAMVTNQSGVAKGLIERGDVDAVNQAVVDLVGRLDAIAVCAHDDAMDCACRKPKPGLILEAAAILGVDPTRCVVVGDSMVDVIAAERAGARAILVTNGAPARSARTPGCAAVVPTFGCAVDVILDGL
jgi:histidinol-phosphate phosphatase family protein